MVFHIAVCSPDAALRSGLERQCMEYFARRQDACIVQQLPDAAALLRRDTEENGLTCISSSWAL